MLTRDKAHDAIDEMRERAVRARRDGGQIAVDPRVLLWLITERDEAFDLLDDVSASRRLSAEWEERAQFLLNQ